MTPRLAIVCALALASCGDRQARENPKPTSLELAISHDLDTRLHTSTTTRCAIVAGNPVKCEATLTDGTKLPIEIKGDKRDWVWRVAGIVVETKPVTEWVNGELSANAAFVMPDGKLHATLAKGVWVTGTLKSEPVTIKGFFKAVIGPDLKIDPPIQVLKGYEIYKFG